MRRSVKITIAGLFLVAAVAASPFLFEQMVIRMGEHSLRKLADEGNFCQTADCSEGIEYTIGFLETNYALSPDNVKFCMGVDVIAHYELPIGNGLKSALTDRLYKRCGDPANDEPDEDLPPE